MRSMTRVEHSRASSLNSSCKGEASKQHVHGFGELHSKHKAVLGMRKNRVLGHHSKHKAVDPCSGREYQYVYWMAGTYPTRHDCRSTTREAQDRGTHLMAYGKLRSPQ